MSHNGNVIYKLIDELKDLAMEADVALQRLRNLGTGGGEISPSVLHDLNGHVRRTDLAVEAFLDETVRLAALMETGIPIKELRHSLSNNNLRAKLSPKVQAAWDALVDLIDNPPETLTEELAERCSVCGEPLYLTPGVVTCNNGHDLTETLTPGETPLEEAP